LARTVLLADDSVTAQNMGRRILMDAGYQVITVNNGSAALKKIHENRPDLIVLDVYMPGYGGLEVCQRLKESDDTMRIPVLLSVGKMEPFKAEEAKRVRADGHIVKPFEASELLAALTRLEDRIVPQPQPPRGLWKSDEKKARLRQPEKGEDNPARIPERPSEKVAYLSQIKQRLVENLVQDEAAEDFAANGKSPVATEDTSAHPTTPALPAQESLESAPITAAAFTVEQPVQDFPVQSEVSGETQSEIQVEAQNEVHYETESDPDPQPPVMESFPEEPVTAAVFEAALVIEPRWVAENVPLTVEEASLALDQEMQQAQAVSTTALSEPAVTTAAIPDTRSDTSSDSAGATFPAASDDTAAVASAAFAAAASAGLPALAENAVTPEPEPVVPSEAAAAWDNWQQIRDSVMSPQKAAAIAESAALIVQANTPAQDSDPSAKPILESSAIANIVDSVLAELKPKLMEEIAKKMAAEKK
jgi:CheY-like chemotaxis protein